MMSTVRTRVHGLLSFGLIALAITSLTGCVGPMACPPGCGGCDGGGCGGGGCSPFASACSAGACSGCGELYIDPWINHPADTCDPCDVCGNHNGQSCGKCRSVFDGVATMWGYRCASGCDDCVETACDAGPCPGCGPDIINAAASVVNAIVSCGTCGEVDCGCDAGFVSYGDAACGCDVGCGVEVGCGLEVGCEACGEVACGCDGGPYGLETIHAGEVYLGGHPTPLRREVADVAPTEQPYQPSRTRKIFRTRPDVAEVPDPSNY